MKCEVLIWQKEHNGHLPGKSAVEMEEVNRHFQPPSFDLKFILSFHFDFELKLENF